MLPGMEYKPIGISPDDMQVLDARKFSVVEIARFFRVPPTMIGDMTRVSYSSSESELGLFQVHTIVPWCANLESEINAKLFPARSKFSAKFDVNSLSRGDQQSRYTAYGQGLMAGFLTVADVRLAEGLPFIPGTDQLNRPANVVPNTGEHTNGPQLPAA
jgi:HK97 family phage portal protein